MAKGPSPDSGQMFLFGEHHAEPSPLAEVSATARPISSAFAITPVVLFIDMNAFYASVEQQDNPALRGRPVAVVPVLAENTTIIAASYEAKRPFGIKTGMSVREARERCPELHIIAARRERYLEIHAEILTCLSRHFNSIRPLSVDEMACRLEPAWRTPEAAEDLAHAIKGDLIKTLGTCMKCSIGIGPNNFLAKIAADLQKPDGLTIFKADYPQRLTELALQDLPGIGAKTEAKLHAAGIRSVQDLLAASPDELRKAFGGPAGVGWYQKLRGSLEFDYSPYASAGRQFVGRSRVLAPEFRTGPDAQRIIRQLAGDALRSLRAESRLATRVEVAVAYPSASGFRSVHGEEVRITPSNSDFEWGTQLGALIDSLVSAQRRPFWVHVGFSDLVGKGEIPPGLLDSAHSQQRDAAAAVMDQINARFGLNNRGEKMSQPASRLGPAQKDRVIPFGPPKRGPA